MVFLIVVWNDSVKRKQQHFQMLIRSLHADTSVTSSFELISEPLGNKHNWHLHLSSLHLVTPMWIALFWPIYCWFAGVAWLWINKNGTVHVILAEAVVFLIEEPFIFEFCKTKTKSNHPFQSQQIQRSRQTNQNWSLFFTLVRQCGYAWRVYCCSVHTYWY